MSAPGVFVRTIARGERIAALVEESKARAWVANAEHAALRLVTGERLLVQGGPGGIEFEIDETRTRIFFVFQGKTIQVTRIYFHTHPRVTGPSSDDLEVLSILRQTRSYLFEIGGEPSGTLIRPKGVGHASP